MTTFVQRPHHTAFLTPRSRCFHTGKNSSTQSLYCNALIALQCCDARRRVPHGAATHCAVPDPVWKSL